MSANDSQQLAIDAFLSAIFHKYGYDFRDYSPNNRRNRVAACLSEFDFESLEELTLGISRDKDLFYEILSKLTITVTHLFRNPSFFRAVQKEILPYLKELPSFKVWHAGCSSGEEVFSMMILLEEAGLLDRAVFYGTDINPKALKKARSGIVSAEALKRSAKAYHEAGGQYTLTDYFRVNHGFGLFRRVPKFNVKRKPNIVISVHNLATDTSFGEMQVIFCRNVLIYFNEELQNRALELLTASLMSGGYLCLGIQETLMFSSVDSYYDTIDKKHKIYRKK